MPDVAGLGHRVVGAGDFGRRDDGHAAMVGLPVPEYVGVMGSVGDEPLRHGDPPQERYRSNKIVGLTGRYSEFQGASGMVGYGTNFGHPSAASSADGLLEVPLLSQPSNGPL